MDYTAEGTRSASAQGRTTVERTQGMAQRKPQDNAPSEQGTRPSEKAQAEEKAQETVRPVQPRGRQEGTK